jgi:hypothetical protein
MTIRNDDSVSRRAAIAAGTAAVAGLALVAGEEAIRGTLVGGLVLNDGEAPTWLFAPFHEGSALALGWRMGALSPVSRGAAVLELVHTSGRAARVHLCAHDGQPKGVAHTALLDLVLMDGRAGEGVTDEDLGRVLLGLAAHVRTNELSADGDLAPLARMTTHGARVMRYGPHTLT